MTIYYSVCIRFDNKATPALLHTVNHAEFKENLFFTPIIYRTLSLCLFVCFSLVAWILFYFVLFLSSIHTH